MGFQRINPPIIDNIYNVFYVYILKNKNDKTYIGCTNDLKDRLSRHNKGCVEATKNNIPWKVIAYFAFIDEGAAFKFEKYLKSGSGRAFVKKHNFLEV